MSLLDDEVAAQIIEMKEDKGGYSFTMTIENTVNVALVADVAHGGEVDIFGDTTTPEQTNIINEVSTLLDNYVNATQQLVKEIEYDVNDIFRP